MPAYEFTLELVENVRKITAGIRKSIDSASQSTNGFQRKLDVVPNSIRDIEHRLDVLKTAKKDAFSRKEVKQYNKEIQKLEKELRDIDDLPSEGIAGRFNFINKSAKGLLATMGGLLALNEVKQFTQEVGEIQNQVQLLFSGSAEEISHITKQAYKVASVSGEDYQTVISSTNSLVKQMGIEAPRAFELVNTAIKKGANVNGELFDSLKEYPAQLKAVGYSAEESLALITESAQMGVWSDKAVDSIKEAGDRIGRLEKPATDALKALGFDPKQIQAGLDSGSLSVKQVIQQVSGEISKLPQNSVAARKAIEGIFGTPGVDAGADFIATLAQTKKTLDDVQGSSSDFVQSQQYLMETWAVLKVQIAERIMPLFVQLIDWVKHNRAEIEYWGSIVLKVSGILVGLYASAKLIMGIQAMIKAVQIAYLGLAKVTGIVKVAQAALNFVMNANPIGLLITAVGTLALGLWAMRDRLKGFYSDIKLYFAKAYDWVYNNFVLPMVKAGEYAVGWIPGVDVDTSESNWASSVEAEQLISKVPEEIRGEFRNILKNQGLDAAREFAIAQREKFLKREKAEKAEKAREEQKAKQIAAAPQLKVAQQPTGNLGISKGLSQVRGGGGRSTNVTISIDKLVEQLIVQTQQFSQTPAEVKQKMTEALLEAVNNANQAT